MCLFCCSPIYVFIGFCLFAYEITDASLCCIVFETRDIHLLGLEVIIDFVGVTILIQQIQICFIFSDNDVCKEKWRIIQIASAQIKQPFRLNKKKERIIL